MILGLYMCTTTLVLHYVATCVPCDLKRLFALALALALSFFSSTQPNLFLSLYFFFFAVMHYYYYRRMTTNNNNKSDSPPPLSLLLSHNHHRFVSFVSAVPSIINVIATAFFSSSSSLSMFRPYDYYYCYWSFF